MNIYRITNRVNGKVYIGQTKHPIEKRYAGHIGAAKSPCNKSRAYHLQNAMRKYGIDSFVCELIDTASSPEETNRKEMKWIAKYQSHLEENGYNSSYGGDNWNWKRSRKSMAKTIMTRKTNLMARTGEFIGVYWDEERDSYRYEIKQDNRLLEIRRGFPTQQDGAWARDMALVRFITDDEECKMYMNFPHAYEDIVAGRVEQPARRMKRVLKVAKLKWVQYDPIQDQWIAMTKGGGDKTIKKGMFTTEEEAAVMADVLHFGLKADTSVFNFPERMAEYGDPSFKPPQTVLQKRKTSAHRYVTRQSKKGRTFWSVDTRTFPPLTIRKCFKTEEEAVTWRNERFKEAGLALPD